MAMYQLEVEGVFVSIPGEGSLLGFFCTFFVSGSDVMDAKSKLEPMLRDRLNRHKVVSHKGIFSAHHLIKNVWEVEEITSMPSSDGFSFYRITAFSSIFSLARVIATKWVRPNRLIELES